MPIVCRGLTKRYGATLALDGLDLDVRPGEIFGFLGPNGSGKTTAIRLFVDILRPTQGSVRIFGEDPRTHGVEVRHRIGYLPGDFVVDPRQTSRDYLTYLANLRGGFDRTRIGDLADRLGLDIDLRIRTLSRGNRQKIGLIQAFMHNPDLLILDEPTSGLDPLMAREFLSMASEARAEGQTVFMSSHILSEVQHVADRAAIIRRGRLIAIDEVETLRSRALRRVEITFANPPPLADFAALEGVSAAEVADTTLSCRLAGSADGLIKTAARHRVINIISEEPDLEELFIHYYSGEAADAQ